MQCWSSLLCVSAGWLPQQHEIHIESVIPRGDTDTRVWEYARANDYILVSRHNDFRQRVFLLGPPPKVIWLNTGNSRTNTVAGLLRMNFERIRQFATQPEEGLLILP